MSRVACSVSTQHGTGSTARHCSLATRHSSLDYSWDGRAGGLAQPLGNRAQHTSAPALATLHGQGPAQRGGPVVHDAQAEAMLGRQLVRQPHAVVLDRENNGFVVRLEPDQDALGFAVLDGIVDGLLGDAIEINPCHAVIRNGGGVAAELAVGLEDAAGALGEVFKGRSQAIGGQLHRRHRVRQLAGVADGLAGEPRDFLGPCGFDRGLAGQTTLQGLAQELDAGKLLAQVIVQILADAPLHALADPQDFLLQRHAPGDVADGVEELLTDATSFA